MTLQLKYFIQQAPRSEILQTWVYDSTFRAYKSKHKRKLNMSEYRHLQMKKAEKPDYLPDPAEGTRS